MLSTCITRCRVWQGPKQTPTDFNDLVTLMRKKKNSNTRMKIWRKAFGLLVVMVIIGAALFAMSTVGGDDRVKPVVETDGPFAVAGGSGTCTNVGSLVTGGTAVPGTTTQDTAAATTRTYTPLVLDAKAPGKALGPPAVASADFGIIRSSMALDATYIENLVEVLELLEKEGHSSSGVGCNSSALSDAGNHLQLLAADVMIYADVVGAVAHSGTLLRAAAAISNLATIVHEVPQLDLHSGHAKLKFGAAVQAARVAHSVLVNANDAATAEHHMQQKAVSIDISKGSAYTAFYATIGNSSDDPAWPGSVAELSFCTKTSEAQNRSTREHGDIGVVDTNVNARAFCEPFFRSSMNLRSQGGTGVGCSADGKVAARWNFLSTAANALGGDLSDWGGLVYKPRTPVHNCSMVGGAPCASSASETGMMRNSLEPQDFLFVPEEGNVRQNDEQVIFQDGPQVHQCKCNPGWCVSPLQRAHPRPTQPSD